MLLAAVGKPHTLPEGTEFNRKFGIWPFVENVEAQRLSKNRVQGTVELKGINVTTEDFFQKVTKRGELLDCKEKIAAVNNYTIIKLIDRKLKNYLRAGFFGTWVTWSSTNTPELNSISERK